MTPDLILASASPFRKTLLQNAGLTFVSESAQIDERAVEETVQGLDAEDLATILAEAKAQDVSSRHPGAIVIGSDQTLSLDGEIFHKPENMDQARRRLLKLSGRTHLLNSAVALARDGETLWRHVSVARMTMRQLDPGFVGRHLANVGDRALSSVGAYQFEGEGIQLFERIEGDYFAIIGLPLLPLLAQLRELAIIDG
ncbi:Maf-like protein [Hoeflea sp. G2-23]|uniref:7-methyl-GTP pyrophosphatase n=1 Tax=Hoeflea algicola TaxID=2983763 RepID=A0ABT3ZBB7_9HYPH|nr:Maf-like protein [Hoeflea algicola]MCY0149057.1 Maf-like protein [Hoeflea algicola]